jgi:putative PIN family toxin of toxin-antitoxin system
MIVVLDTNVLVSSLLLPGSVPFRARAVAQQHCDILYSAATLSELTTVLERPKFRKYLSTDDTLAFIERIRDSWTLVHIGCAVHVCTDPDDDKFLDVAVCGGGTHIITGDRALLDLHPFQGITILTPRDFIDTQRNPNTDQT